jgi:hypothetical protein
MGGKDKAVVSGMSVKGEMCWICEEREAEQRVCACNTCMKWARKRRDNLRGEKARRRRDVAAALSAAGVSPSEVVSMFGGMDDDVVEDVAAGEDAQLGLGE